MAGVKSNQGSKRGRSNIAGATQYDIHKVQQAILQRKALPPDYKRAMDIKGPNMGDAMRMEKAIRAREKAGVENRSKAAEEYNKRFKPRPKTSTPRKRAPSKGTGSWQGGVYK